MYLFKKAYHIVFLNLNERNATKITLNCWYLKTIYLEPLECSMYFLL